MKPLNRYHPFTNFIFFLMVILLTGILQNPGLTLTSCVVALVTFYAFKKKSDHTFGPLLALCILVGLINPLISHHGATILFYINNTPVTKEACIYGIFLSLQLLQLILWFKILSLSLTSDHIMCLFGSFSPRLALLFSMTLRFVPEFTEHFRKIENASITMGVYRGGSIWEKIKGKCRIFLSVAGYALENGIITADSMEARGYSLPRRSSYRRFRFRKRDFLVLLLIVLLSAPMIVSYRYSVDRVSFYPNFQYNFSIAGLFSILIPGLLLTLIPLILLISEAKPWKK